jgi:hypothetical protein
LRKPTAGIPILLLGRKELLASKLAAGRPKDLEDIRCLASDDPEAS